jgi:riboflavin kinase / FMN adenylyltransferase
MEVLREVGSCPQPPPAGTVVTIGAYDGVHRGHRAVIAAVRARAATAGMETVAVTFDRHPASVVRPASAPRLLTDLDQKLELLADTGLDRCLVLAFDEVRSKEPAEDFVREVLVECLGAKVVIVGEDFHFGHQRRGNVALLEQLGSELGFEVEGLALVDASGRAAVDDGERTSSTAIRHALVTGDLERAARMLGRSHEVRGVVARGDARGRELGFPTANVSVPGDVLLPADGIYAGWYERPDGSVHASAISLGRRPTFYEEAHASLLEAHLLDFEGDLYGEAARVRFVTRLRGEERFDDVEALVAQIARDCDDARAVLV